MDSNWITVITTWVTLVLVLLITFNGYLTIKEFTRIHQGEEHRDSVEDEQHRLISEQHLMIAESLDQLHHEVSAIKKIVDNRK